jgi:hypothetical protein
MPRAEATHPTRQRHAPWRPLISAALLTAALTAAAPAFANEGSFLFTELHAGVSLPLGAQRHSIGPSLGATLGMGGRIPGTPLRAFALAHFNYSQFEILRHTLDATTTEALNREMVEGALGGRLLVAVTPTLRVFVDLNLALSWLEREEFFSGFGTVTNTDRSPRASLLSALGIQWRPLELFSVGARSDFGFLLDTDRLIYTNDDFDEISGRLNLCLTLALHL